MLLLALYQEKGSSAYLQFVGCSHDHRFQGLLITAELDAMGLVHTQLTHSSHHAASYASQSDLVIIHLQPNLSDQQKLSSLTAGIDTIGQSSQPGLVGVYLQLEEGQCSVQHLCH